MTSPRESPTRLVAHAGLGTSPPRVRKSDRYHASEVLIAGVFLAPDVIGLLIFLVLPMVLSVIFSLYDISGFGQYTFVGLGNYEQMLGDDLFWNSLRVTSVYALAFVVLVFVVGLLLALLVSDAFPGLAFVRTVFFTPYVISLVVIGVLWTFLLTDKRGFVTTLLSGVGLGGVSWLGDPRFALGTLVFVSVWAYAGYYMLIFLAGLKDIPGEYYDAAQVDGANAIQRFFYVTWPLLKPTSFFVLLTSIIASISGPQAFDLVFVTTKGGPVNSTETIVTYIYQQAFLVGHFGYAAAIAFVVLLALLCISLSLFALTRAGRFDVG